MNYQFTSRQLTLDNLSRSNQGHMTFKRLHLLHGASSYQILHETHIVNHIWSFSLHDYGQLSLFVISTAFHVSCGRSNLE